MQDAEIFDAYERHISPSYPAFLSKLGIEHTAVKAQGAVITASDGKEYLDCVSGYGLHNLGHNHPEIVQELINQLQASQQLARPFIIDKQVELAEKLAEISPGDLSCTLFCNSGSEAVDSAIKLARLIKKKSVIISAQGAFHGYTYGALSASGIPSVKRSFAPLIPAVEQVPFGDIEALQKKISPETGAVLLEPIQHEAGVNTASTGYFKEVRRLCDEYNALLVLDEIKTGFGKTGRMFACEIYGVVPDLLVLGKSMGGGIMPIGALVGKKQFWTKLGLSFPMTASSYAGNVLACVAALKTIDILENQNLLTHCRNMGNMLFSSLEKAAQKYPGILKHVSGLGLLNGIQAASPMTAVQLVRAMIAQNILVFQSFGSPSWVTIEPPLVISSKQISSIVRALEKACSSVQTKIQGM